MSLLLSIVEHLSVNIGPRPSASAQELEAARYLDNLFRERGLESRVISNLESLGCGQLKYIEREGMFPVLRADQYLRNLAEKAAKNKRVPFVAGRFHTILTDNVSVLARKLPGLTLMGCGPDQLIPYWHQSGDTLENIREENLLQAVELVKEMVTLLDTGNAYG